MTAGKDRHLPSAEAAMTLSEIYERICELDSPKAILRRAQSNMIDNGDGTFSFVRPKPYKEVAEADEDE